LPRPMPRTNTSLTAVRRLLWIAIVALTMLGPAAVQASATANFLGKWNPTTGQPWTVTSQAPDGSCTGYSSLSGFSFSHCQVNGNEYKFDVDEEGTSYESHNSGTISGNSLKGEFNDTNGTHEDYTAVREGGSTSVSGQVLDNLTKGAKGVKIAITGTSDEAKPVSLSAQTDALGKYSIEVPPGTYTVTASGDPTEQSGGTLEVMKVSLSGGSTCSGTAKGASCALTHLASGEEGQASFTYTMCAATARTAEGKEPTGCPIIFIPGILGSKIVCNTGEVYFHLPVVKFDELLLNVDGETVQGDERTCNGTAHTPSGEEGLLTNVGPKDVYGGMFNFLKGIGTNGVYAYPYDWRRSVPAAISGLEKLVNEVLEKSGAKHVVLVAHSMGGLVTQQYIATGTNAEKVSRAVTIGTPYWGAPKSMVALLNGRSNEFATEPLDFVFGQENLQYAVRNYTGLFWLYPSAAYGPWLTVEGLGFPRGPMGGIGVAPWVESLGGNRLALASAELGHGTLDGFKPNGVDYQIVVGTGLPTITGMKFSLNEMEPEQLLSATYGSGDATVPAISQTQGAFPGLNSPVGIRYVCGVGHSDEPGTPAIQEAIKEFVLSGAKVSELSSPCLFTGTEIVIYKTRVVGHGGIPASVKTAQGAAVTLEQAIAKGLVQVLELGGQTIVVTSGTSPVTLAISGKGLTMRVKSLSSKGESQPSLYGPVSGTITIAGASVSRGGKRLRSTRPAGAPHVSAHVSRHGKRFQVTLSARSRKGLRGIYYRFGKKGARHAYTHPLTLTRSQLKVLRFAGVSVFGVWEPAQRAHA
jgi:pimeloyl-ACP methyl ester carboxylesterase